MEPSPSPGPRHGEMSGDGPSTGREHVGSLAGLPAELLYEETVQLKEALELRPGIDVVRGVLMGGWSCAEEDAWQILVQVSQHSNTKLHDVAEAIVAITQQVPLPPTCKTSWPRRWLSGAAAAPTAGAGPGVVASSRWGRRSTWGGHAPPRRSTRPCLGQACPRGCACPV